MMIISKTNKILLHTNAYSKHYMCITTLNLHKYFISTCEVLAMVFVSQFLSVKTEATRGKKCDQVCITGGILKFSSPDI